MCKFEIELSTAAINAAAKAQTAAQWGEGVDLAHRWLTEFPASVDALALLRHCDDERTQARWDAKCDAEFGL